MTKKNKKAFETKEDIFLDNKESKDDFSSADYVTVNFQTPDSIVIPGVDIPLPGAEPIKKED